MPGRATPPMPERLCAAMGDQRIDQRAGRVAGAGMDHEPGRLVDDDERVVLIDDVEGNGLGAAAPAASAGGRSSAKRSPGLTRYFTSTMVAPAQGDVALFDQALHAGAAQLGQALAEEAVEPLPFMARIGFRVKPLEGGSFL